MQTVTHRSFFLPAMSGLIVLAWAVLWTLEGSVAAHLLHGHLSAPHSVSQALSNAGMFWIGWVLMSVAMMLPATLPLMLLFQRMTRGRAEASTLMAAMTTGYIGAWAAMGLVLTALRPLLGAWIGHLPRLSENPWATSAGLFLVAGAFQFSSLKYRCLDQCRSPLAFLSQHWGGRRNSFTALRMGWLHGLYCLGCCWALMLLMFAASGAHLLWMLVLGIVMATEKNLSWGRHLARPLGLTLLAAGIALAALNVS